MKTITAASHALEQGDPVKLAAGMKAALAHIIIAKS